MTPEETKLWIEKESREAYPLNAYYSPSPRRAFIEGANLVLNTIVAEKDQEIAELKAAGEKMADAFQTAKNGLWLSDIDWSIVREALSAWNALTKKAG